MLENQFSILKNYLNMHKPLIVITGGSRGLGFHTAKYLSKMKWNLVIVDISPKACTVYRENKNYLEVKNKLKNNNLVDFEFGDLTNEKNVVRILKSIEKKYKKIDGLVNFAGGDISGYDNLASGKKPKNNNFFINYKDFKSVYERNFLSTYYMVKHCIPIMKKNRSGKIVNISSISGTFGVDQEYAYGSAKSNIVHLTRSTASFTRKWDINVNCIAPCGTKSARFLKLMKSRSKVDRARLKQKGRLAGFAQPEDISKAVYFLLSDLSDFVSGQIIRLDGGEFTSAF